MEKVEFVRHNPNNHPIVNGRGTNSPILTIQATGKFVFNKPLVDALKLKEGDTIEFLQHPTEKDTWKIEKSKDGFKLHKDVGETLRLANASLNAAVKDSMECPHNWTLRLVLLPSGVFGRQSVLQPKSRNNE